MAEGVNRDLNPDDFESEGSFISDSDNSNSDGCDRSMNQKQNNQPCRYYNAGSCRDGSRCSFLHVCQYYFNGKCKYGAKCRYKHDRSEWSTTSDSDDDDDENSEPQNTTYQWQIYGEKKWQKIRNDWLIEAQYSQPDVIGMKIFNTPFGVISIDFKRMSVRGKDLKVRRISGRDDRWLWYCRCDSHWNAYGEKDSQGKSSNVNSTELERQYQMNRETLYKYTVDVQQYQINFKEMKQTNVTTGTRRTVRRRPQFMGIKTDSPRGVADNSNPSRKPVWQFSGDTGGWHNFKQRGMSDSVGSDQLESSYQQNSQGSISYTIGKFQYNLDFSAMIQTNCTTGKVRKVQRV